MLKVPFDEFVDLFVDVGTSRFHCQVLHPSRRELLDV